MAAYTYPPFPPVNGGSFLQSHKDTYPLIDLTKHSNHPVSSVFITGASKGIGRAIALSFAKAGTAQIAIGARSCLASLESEIFAAAESAGKTIPKVLALKLDVESPESAKDAAEAVQKEFGRLDLLINNAGYMEPTVLIGDSDPVDHWKAWDVNYRGVFNVTREFLPLLLNSEDGFRTIVNVGSRGAMSLRPGMSGYQTSKFAVLKFTECLCTEYAEKGLVAFVVHPGGVATELSLKLPKHMQWELVDTPELAGDSIVWLTRERREWLAGRYISCNWDMAELMRLKDEIIEGDKLKLRLVL